MQAFRYAVGLLFLTQFPLAAASGENPNTITCSNKLKDKFRFLITTDTKPHDISVNVYVRERGKFARSVFSKTFNTIVENDVTDACLFRNYCFKLVVADSAGDGLCCEHGNGFYKGYWNGQRFTTNRNWDSESVSYFGACEVQPSTEPSISASPSTSAVPTVSSIPTPDGTCQNDLKERFHLVMTTDNKPRETSFKIFVKEDGEFRRTVFEKQYTDVVSNHVTDNCMFSNYCFKLVVYDSRGDGLCCEDGNGSYQAYFNGVLFKDDQFENGSESVSYFGNCDVAPPPPPPSLPGPPGPIPVNPPPAPVDACPNPHKDELEVLINTDVRGVDNYFRIFRATTPGNFNQPVYSIWRLSPSTDNQSFKQCLQTRHCYKFVMYDRESDGMCCEHGQGSYMLRWNHELIKSSNFVDGGESISYFGNCPTLSPSISTAPSTTEMPSNAPITSVAPSSKPSERYCEELNRERFQMVMSPPTGTPSDVYYEIVMYKSGAVHKTFTFDRYWKSDVDQGSNRCLKYDFCYKAIVYSKSSTGIKDGSFSAYWEGSQISFADPTFGGASTESGTFGKTIHCP